MLNQCRTAELSLAPLLKGIINSYQTATKPVLGTCIAILLVLTGALEFQPFCSFNVEASQISGYDAKIRLRFKILVKHYL